MNDTACSKCYRHSKEAHLFIHSFKSISKYLLSVYYVPCSGLSEEKQSYLICTQQSKFMDHSHIRDLIFSFELHFNSVLQVRKSRLRTLK